MAGEQKRQGGWWIPAVLILVPLLTIYIGSYYWTVGQIDDFTLPGGGDSDKPVAVIPAYGPVRWWRYHPFTRPLFRPIHQVDRMLRPKVWTLPPD
jgi:hypothetical protein